jgi:molecular chaperone DnaK
MSRTTIDFGIDLGTTNSAIALLNGVQTEIIKNNSDGDITPSVVSIDKKGITQVGQRARNRLIENPDDAYAEFKRRMGTDYVYQFKSSGQGRKPEELSAEVLKSLRADVQQRTGEVLEAAVITVPAAFELHQCDATRTAAQLAGFRQSPLLQEPVAAALAYGFQVSNQNAYWLVYDFGGGTFDAAIIKAEDGIIHVVNHGGDNFLGGAEIDWAIVEELLVPRILEQNLLDDFKRGNPRWRQAFAKLKRSAEMAKIDLSRTESTILETCRFEDDSGKEIEFETELSRAHLIKVAQPVILRSTEICKRVMKEKNLEAGAIEKVILVGGPTLAPYFRDILAANLGIPLDHSSDPMTVVARGAAIFAGTQSFQSHATAPAAGCQFTIDLKYQPVGASDSPSVGARVSALDGRDLVGFQVEFVNQKTLWRSGRVALPTDGVLMVDVNAEKGEKNTFQIELFDSTGQKHAVHPAEFHYTVGSVLEEQPLINSMGIALADNQYERFFEKGSGLPLRATHTFRTTQPLRQGQTGAILRIPLVEGEQTAGDRNRKVGELEIRAENIRRDLPGYTDIEVNISITADRIIRITAYVPLLDETFEGKIDMRRHHPQPSQLKADFELEMKRYHEMLKKLKASENREVEKLARDVDGSALMGEVRSLLESAPADPDAAAQCEKRLLELKLKLDEVTIALEWPTLISSARATLNDLNRNLNQSRQNSHRERARELGEDIEECIREQKADRLRRKIEQTHLLIFEIVQKDPNFWVQAFRKFELDRHKLADQARGALLLEQGRDCIAKNNFIVLQNVVQQLGGLLPNENLLKEQRGYQSGILR